MPRPRYYWFGHVQKTIVQYMHNNLGNSTQDMISRSSIEEALEQTRRMIDGEDRIKLIVILYCRRTHTVSGAAMLLYISERTAQSWNSDFVYKVARNMGYLESA